MTEPKAARTIAATNGVAADTAYGAVIAPIHLSTTYKFPAFEKPGPYDYSRLGNPTRDQLADTIAKLEGGARAVVVSSGMAALDLALSSLRPGDLLIAPHDCYGGTHRLLSLRSARGHYTVAFVDQNDPAALAAAFAGRPKVVLIETPSNPLMRVVDVRRVTGLAREAGALSVVDNTFLSPALQRPLALGADLVVHATTKFLNGHSDVVGGAVVAADAKVGEELAAWANTIGVTGSPFDAYLTLRGVRTLFVRIEQQQKTAGRLAAFLAGHPAVAAVYYPGLETHPGHALAKAQQSGFGAMLSFELAGGREAVRRFVAVLRVFTLAESLGGVESLISHAETMTHAAMDPEARVIAGITDGLLRLSIGLEAEDDLLADLSRALDALPPA
ncbi:cystathionine gamma-synthase [Methylobacterium sp. WL30]|uniref:cystathionine gamma-synthase n=1 Tax=unclassified Methylobacterium TaxID=2615210 RepID=UPI0011C848FC|nr:MULTISPECIES: cystathionine gamma-synthase [unclassified Methylobacterium]TXM89265.1 cystathionine gamma-synthase [Methylobacterium sp. WL116]TXN19375.1 cystathionine gamma-synthase [Methylobacterium sp. WL93]TXN46981.1 cystathionine gamma-synthase [Methylobacterium sp. WL119]TXN64795.1 cystathionine gamma-synthase [Methylobacterium sp. WL30]